MKGDPDYILADALNRLEKCEKDFLDNKLVDMASFEASIVELCNIVLKLPADEAKKYDKDLSSLVERLTQLSAQIQEKMQTLKGDINLVNKQMKATTAYKKSSQNNES